MEHTDFARESHQAFIEREDYMNEDKIEEAPLQTLRRLIEESKDMRERITGVMHKVMLYPDAFISAEEEETN